MMNNGMHYGVLQVQGPGGADEHPLLKKAVDVGRSPECDLVVDDPTVSRRHVRLSYTGQGYLVQDLGSGNGTLLNGQPLPPRRAVPLRPGDVVQAGSVQLAVRVPTADEVRFGLG